MKLLFYVAHFSLCGSGLENDAVYLCKALASRGHDVHVACADGDDLPDITIHRQFEHLAALRQSVAPDLAIDWGMYAPADIHRIGGGIHAPFLEYSLNAYSGPARLIKQLEHKKAKQRRVIDREAEILGNPSARFLAISQMVADHAVACGARANRTDVLYNAVDLDRYSPETRARYRQETRELWQLEPQQTAFLFVAHNLKLKNLALLKSCFDALYAAHPDIVLLVCGKRKPGFSAPYVKYVGMSAEIERFYAGADALLHPSFYDSFANVVLEAMACGLPIVVSQDSGVSELITNGTDGIVLDVRERTSQADWEAAIARLTDSSVRDQFGSAGVATAAKYPSTALIDRFVEYCETFERATEGA